MSKKSRKPRNNKDTNIVHTAFDNRDWHPLDDEINGRRDQKYVKNIKPRSDGQAALMKAIDEYSLTMAIGPAGTGKTYIAISKAAEALEKGQIERIILSRPAMKPEKVWAIYPVTYRKRWHHICAPCSIH